MADKTDKKYRDVFKTLLRKTNEGEINWMGMDQDQGLDEVEESLGPDQTLSGQPYYATYKGKKLYIFSLKERNEQNEAFDWVESDWTKETILGVQDPETGGTWRFPSSSLLDDLLESVRREASGVNEWMRDVLND